MTPAGRPIHVVGAVITHNGRILACRRRPGVRDAGLWEFPGGKVEAGESPEIALQREVQEELGVSIAVGGLVARSITPAEPHPVELSCYYATALDALPASSRDHDLLRWMVPKDLSSLGWLEADIPVSRQLMGWGYGSAPLTVGVVPDDPWHKVWRDPEALDEDREPTAPMPPQPKPVDPNDPRWDRWFTTKTPGPVAKPPLTWSGETAAAADSKRPAGAPPLPRIKTAKSATG
ncbi:MAG: (deoxy)nucleoside triphosphate pyrophosphohydrolase [Micrococcales bacterium]|nr:(deoxy)nucleoside triphosphate pyrophosphohydrolase [Micrococcales bacterium]